MRQVSSLDLAGVGDQRLSTNPPVEVWNGVAMRTDDLVDRRVPPYICEPCVRGALRPTAAAADPSPNQESL